MQISLDDAKNEIDGFLKSKGLSIANEGIKYLRTHRHELAQFMYERGYTDKRDE